MKKIILKNLLFSFIALAVSLVIFFVNIFTDAETMQLAQMTKILDISLVTFEESVVFTKILLLLYALLFFLSFLCYLSAELFNKKYNKKINGNLIFFIILALLLARSIITEPFLYQVFYEKSFTCQFIIDALTFFDIKIFIDTLLILIFLTQLFLLFRYFAFIAVFLFLTGSYLVQNPVFLKNKIENNETVIYILVDSLRKDAVEENNDLFINQITRNSVSVENMYTVFPASVPTLASIFSTDYPYKFNGTSMFLNNQMDLSFVNELKKNYKLSLHTDYTDDDIVNRSNFNIPFDKIHAPYIDNATNFRANIIKKNIILLSIINSEPLRNLLLPEYYQSDSNSNNRNTINSALNYLNKNKGEKKLAFVSLSSPHIPFEAKYPYYRKYSRKETTEKYAWLFDYKDHTYTGFSKEANDNIRNLYMMTVHDADNEVRYFYDKLKKLGLTKNSTIIITSDQGEGLFDDDLYIFSHNNIDAKTVINVPFYLIKENTEKKTAEGNYALMDSIKIAFDIDNIENYKRKYIYLEADVDLKNVTSPLYIFNNRVLSITNYKKAKIVDYANWQKYKKRGLIFNDYMLKYEFDGDGKYYLYSLTEDPLFQNDIKEKEENKELFEDMKNKLDEFINDSYNYINR